MRKQTNNYIAYGRAITIKTICSKQKCIEENCDSAYIWEAFGLDYIGLPP